MGTAIKHLVPDWVNLSFIIFDIWALLGPGLMSKITNDGLTREGSKGSIVKGLYIQ